MDSLLRMCSLSLMLFGVYMQFSSCCSDWKTIREKLLGFCAKIFFYWPFPIKFAYIHDVSKYSSFGLNARKEGMGTLNASVKDYTWRPYSLTALTENEKNIEVPIGRMSSNIADYLHEKQYMAHYRQRCHGWSELSAATISKNVLDTVLQALSHFQRHFGKASPLKIPFFRLTSERIIVDVTASTKVKRHSRTFQNYLGCPGEFRRSLVEKWSEPLRLKIDLEWEHHIELKYNRCLNAALGWELIEREWDNIFSIQTTLIEERNPSRNLTWLLWCKEHKL